MRTIDKLRAALCLHTVIVLGVLGAPVGAGAQAPAPSPAAAQSASPPATRAVVSACGFALSEAVAGAWRDLGGEGGRLGCPTGLESPGAASPQGSANRLAVFGQNGLIVLAVSGPRAGQAFAVSGGCYRLYVQYGGTSSWLGLPVGDQENTPDGSLQRFEGGLMRWDRALDDCHAEQAAAAPAPAAAAAPTETLAPLDLFEDAATGDRLSLATAGSVAAATAAGYQRLRGQARVLAAEAPGTTRLKLYVNEARNLRETLASVQSERDALVAGFAFEAGQGWVWIDPRPGAVALKLYRDDASGRTRLTAGPQDEQEAAAGG
ncbi:MAG TPA: hypothetical protein VKQ54_04465, partial [Caulobacteraceae bacterium]|nr:hypothetical protein [Caulobacteraceae bacterium]